MSAVETKILKLQSVALTREKQLLLQDELDRYAEATNWIIKIALKNHLSKPSKIIEVAQEEFFKRFDKRYEYLTDVIKTACSEIARHRRLAKTIRSMRDKTPFYKRGRAIYSQPIVKISDRAISLFMADQTELPIPFDKYSRNKAIAEIEQILRGDPVKEDSKEKTTPNRRYDRIRLTWNRAGFLLIDIKAYLSVVKK
ncbi:hypothetical protein EU527_11930 [Candidatus Thorarchaeota archaeon]|nr:MAG: hypothetical protein EU527_11930 [Candidatus Thorarchaeota archaeon]